MKRLSIIGLFFLVGLFLIFLFFPSNATRPFQQILGPTPTPFLVQNPSSVVLKDLALSQILPGKTTENDINNMYSSNTESTMSGEAKVFLLPSSSSSFLKNRVFVEKNRVVLVVEEILEDNSLYKDFISQNPSPPVIFSDIHSANSLYVWFVFLQNGVGFFANKETGYTTSVQRFAPINKETYLNTVAKTLSLTEGETPTVTKEDEGID